MKYRIIAMLLCLGLLLSGCRAGESAAAKEESGGTGYGAARKSVLTEQDLYFFTHSTTRATVLAKLGSPQESLMSTKAVDTYRLADGQRLELTYSLREVVETAVYTDENGKSQSLFDYLTALGILKSAGFTPEKPSVDPSEGEEPSPETPDQPTVEKPIPSGGDLYFSNETYSYAMAEQILVVGALRETVLSALGKPNRFSSVDFAKDSYIVDVYVMEDGSMLYLDYGYLRNELRAVRKLEGGNATNYRGEWGAEARPQGFYRITKNETLFSSMKKGTTPANIYRQFGEPDWLEGSEQSWRAAYQLQVGDILYLEFGTANNSLSSALIQRSGGTVSVVALR